MFVLNDDDDNYDDYDDDDDNNNNTLLYASVSFIYYKNILPKIIRQTDR